MSLATYFASMSASRLTASLGVAMAILDQTSPSAMPEDAIVQEASRLQDELESGVVRDVGYDEMIAGVFYRPRGPAE